MTGGERIRILRVIARMNTGGPARQVTSLMRRLDSTRFDQRLLVGSVGEDEVDDLDLRGVDIEYRRVHGLGRVPNAFGDAQALATLTNEVRMFQPHIVHTHTAKAGVLGRLATLSASAIPGRRRPALVHTFHGHLLHGYFSRRVTQAVVGVERALALRTDRLVAVGERVRDELVASGIGRHGQYVVVPPGIELRSLPNRAEARTRLGLAVNEPVAAYVARLTRVKRPDRFADAALRLGVEYPKMHFVVAGDGDLAADLRVRLGPLGERVHFLGWFANVEAVYSAADVVVLTSDNEGMPVSLIEAALAGRPAVTTRVGSAAEVVIDGTTGFVVDGDARAIADAVCCVLADPGVRDRLGRAAKTRAQALFSADRLVADTQALYESLLTLDPR